MKKLIVNVPDDVISITVSVDQFTDEKSKPRLVILDEDRELTYTGDHWKDWEDEDVIKRV